MPKLRFSESVLSLCARLGHARRILSNKSLQVGRPGTGNRLRRLGMRGAAAVEFALVAGPFFMLIFVFIEVLLIMFVQITLDSAVTEEARLIRTGQAEQGQGIKAPQFKAAVCARLYGLADCNNRLFITVQRMPETGRLPGPDEDPNLLRRPPFVEKTGGGSLIVVRGFYIRPLIIPGMSFAFKNTQTTGPRGNLGKNNRLMVATSAFRNEPYK